MWKPADAALTHDAVAAQPSLTPESAPAAGVPSPGHRLQRELGNQGMQRLSRQMSGATLTSTLRGTLSGGEPLGESSRTFMEASLGASLDRVRVHTDEHAVNMSQSLGAEAFTYGRHVYFNANRYAPGTATGAKLLGHELVHTIQQGFHDDPVPDDIAVSDRGDPAEQEAERVSAGILDMRPARASGGIARARLDASRIAPMIQRVEGFDVAVYETKDHGDGWSDAPEESVKIKANSLEEAGTRLTGFIKAARDLISDVSIRQLSFYGHGAPGSQSVGAGEDWDATKEISVKSIAAQPDDYRKMWTPLANGASVYMRGCQVGAEDKGLALLQEVKSSAKKLANRDVEAYGWTGKSYHRRRLWYDWYEQTGQKASSSDEKPKTTWEKLEEREKNKKK